MVVGGRRMSKYKVGDKIVLTVTSTNEMGCLPCYVLNDDLILSKQDIDKYAEPLTTYTEQARANGTEAAWELARKITCQPINGGFNRSEFEEIFDEGYISDIFEKYTYSEAAAKVEAWEKAKEEIKVGDVLENIYISKVKCVVTNLYPDNMAYSIFGDGTAGMHELNNFKKTGRNIDIDSFLKQIGGEQK